MSLLKAMGAWHAASLNKTDMRDEMIQRGCTKDEIKAVSKSKQPYEIYHDTMGSAIDAAYTYARSKGYEPQDLAFWDAVPYGATRDFHIELTRDGKEQKKCLQMQLYRMDSGKYELNCYIN